jgi:hypothetical protein
MSHLSFESDGKCEVVLVPHQLSIIPWRHMWEWRYSSTFLDLGTRWRWGASHFTPMAKAPSTHSNLISAHYYSVPIQIQCLTFDFRVNYVKL